jgi:integrase/recombinase XerD
MNLFMDILPDGLAAYLSERYTPSTMKAYQHEMALYLLRCPNAPTAAHTEVVAYLGSLRSRYTHQGTLRRILAAIKVYYTFLNQSGVRADNPAKSIRLRGPLPAGVQLQDLLTEAELQTLLKRKERYPLLSARNQVLVSLLIYQALEAGEIARLHLSDIDLKKATLYIRPQTQSEGRAGYEGRELSLKASQVFLFHYYIHQARPQLLKGGESPFFLIGHRGKPCPAPDISKHIIRSFKGWFSPRKVNCQIIRQSVIAHLLKQGHDLRIVQVFAGHKNPSSTEAYKQSDVEALQTAIERYHPLG